jgi:acyl carrier protein
MEKSKFLGKLEALMEADAGSLTEQTVLKDTAGWDSMAIMGFIALADEELGMTPDPKAINACKTVADLLKLAGL